MAEQMINLHRIEQISPALTSLKRLKRNKIIITVCSLQICNIQLKQMNLNDNFPFRSELIQLILSNL